MGVSRLVRGEGHWVHTEGYCLEMSECVVDV